MIPYASHVMTLANSIIGVSVLAMPFCFKQCGIILAALVLVSCCLLSRLACHFLIKSAVMSRRRNYEFLAFHAFGPMGKFLVELFIIGFLLGTCIAFFVVIGDLGPQILAKILNKNPENIRTSFLLTAGAIIVLPLGLLRNIDSLASISTITIGFYICLVLKIIVESMGHIFRGDWYDNVNYWRPTGILQCLPIFSMALFCQTQLFEIYESIENPSLEKMNTIVRGAMNICTLVYLCVGFFGYVAFCTQSFSGNILMSFEPSLTSDVIKIGFVLSVVFSFPLVIFPCRASLNSLFFRRVYLHETAIGSTIGVMICLIFPAGFFITISTKNTNERLVAQVILFIGMWIMILGSYANLYAIEESSTTRVSVVTEKPFLPINNIHLSDINDHPPLIPQVKELISKEKENLIPDLKKEVEKPFGAGEPWQEPLIAVERPIEINRSEIKTPKPNNISLKSEFKKGSKKIKIMNKTLKTDENNSIKSKDKATENEVINMEPQIQANNDLKKVNNQPVRDDSINVDALKKEDLEIAAAKEVSVVEFDKKNDQSDNKKMNNENSDVEDKRLLKQKDKSENDKDEFKNIPEKRNLDKNEAILDSNNNKSEERKEIQVPLANVPLVESQGLVSKPLLDLSSNTSNSLIIKNNNSHMNNSDNSNINNNFNKSDNKTDDLYLSKRNQYPLPIVLKMVNQSKEKNSPILNEENKVKNDDDSALAVHRDILEEHVREKRNADENVIISNVMDQEMIGNSVVQEISIDDNKTSSCPRNESRKSNEELSSVIKKEIEVPSTTEPIIKTNAYLTNQKFTDAIYLNENLSINLEYQIVKKRDLKTLKPG
ncbi:putative sodium-coupled neutral amino acid transporter 10 isoform X2 [Chelonus insularis]|uniref:putative sodium-coupled neutral amino acid transporter 10 isoform X2 n=1 Tax=Chelonus insularis TaxID=460826 RepID=UPI00158A3453|nr:putative sodium-coupled neutral amino acid transporter 10 isoform X2 [Chelonus insularis]